MRNNQEGSWRILSKGAEATLYVGEFFGMLAVKKVRHPKKYRDPNLDLKLRRMRTRREARLLVVSKRAGVLVPFVYDVDIENCSIVMEYVSGELLRDYIVRGTSEYQRILNIFRDLGKILAKLHESGIIHGDFTTSNIIVSEDHELFVIDFGLGYTTSSRDPEDFAVELRVFSRGLEVFHAKNYGEYFSAFLDGYRIYPNADRVIERFREIFMRGRYVAERRIRKKFLPQNET